MSCLADVEGIASSAKHFPNIFPPHSDVVVVVVAVVVAVVVGVAVVFLVLALPPQLARCCCYCCCCGCCCVRCYLFRFWFPPRLMQDIWRVDRRFLDFGFRCSCLRHPSVAPH